jgi:hypothetical protein
MGEQIEEQTRAGAYSELKSKKENKAKNAHNHKLETTIWDSKISRISDTGKKITIIKTPLLLWPFRLLTPCGFISVIGIGAIYLLRKDILNPVGENRKKSTVNNYATKEV